ncbi:CASTOR/POLLUX-related putative ion channel [Streptomyces galbus]|uniref:NAD-binding lipoprotein n=1 Tax=Streptomyces galbus TaxID=33898 RepID=A0A4U5WWM0_STRGB|nr:NAD-binding lipoprotein [Streptomyces galbus]TKT06938.1 NAD-binding lipoprotein [Streptomyces galbus]GHD35283.1 lipoprotein [Streptomyces galbus]
MEQRPGAGARARYWFDTTLARGTSALVGWLVLVCLAVVVPTSAALVWTSGHAPATFSGKVAAIWHLTGETMRLGGTTGSPARVALSVLLALVALVYVSTLVGLITTGLTERLIALRRGRSKLLERGHVVVLGWSEQVFTVVSELVAAGANQRRSAVAILADRDKTAMEESLQSKVGPTGRTRLICRSGPSADPAVLALTSPATADSVIVLPPDASRGDADVVKALLALRATARGGDVPVPVVAAVRDSGYLLAARLAAGSRGVVLESDTVTARLIAQAARRPGLSLVHRDLLDFAGNEFYPAAHPSLAGREFGEALLSYGNASAVGLIRGGVPWLNPPARTVLEPDDQLLVIAADDDTAELADCAPLVDERSVASPRPADTRPERLLVLGWNRRAPLVLREWGRNAPPGSVADVVADEDEATVRAAYEAGGGHGDGGDDSGDGDGSDWTCVALRGDTTRPETLAGLDLASYDSVVVLGQEPRAGEPPEEPDTRTLVTLLVLRHLERRTGRALPVVTELTDDGNRPLAPLGPGADVIISGKLIGLLMAQISQNHHLADVFDELFSAGGTQIHLRSAADYVVTGHETAFATVVAAARDRGECAIGYRSHAEARRAPGYGLRLNPPKADRRRWSDGDEVVVIAGEGRRGAVRSGGLPLPRRTPRG